MMQSEIISEPLLRTPEDEAHSSPLDELERVLANTDEVVTLYDYRQSLLERRKESDPTRGSNRDTKRMRFDKSSTSGSHSINLELREMLTLVGKIELKDRLISIAKETYPDRFFELTEPLLDSLFDAFRDVDDDRKVEQEKYAAKKQTELTHIGAAIDSMYPFITDECVPENAANIIQLFELSTKRERSDHPYLDALLRGIAIRLAQPDWTDLTNYIKFPDETVMEELRQRKLNEIYEQGNTLLQEEIQFISLLMDKAESEIVNRLLQASVSILPRAIQHTIENQLRVTLQNFNQNFTNVSKDVNPMLLTVTDQEVDDSALEGLLRRIVLEHFKMAQQAGSTASSRGPTSMLFPKDIRHFLAYLEQKEKGETKRSQRVESSPKPDETQKIETTPNNESIIKHPMVYASVINGTLSTDARPIEDLIAECSKNFSRDPQVALTITSILDKLQSLDFGQVIRGIKKVAAGDGKLRDENGKNLTLLEMKPKEIEGLSVPGGLANAVRVFFTLDSEGTINIFGVVRRRDMKNWLQNHGFPTKNN